MIHKNAWDWLKGQRLGNLDEPLQRIEESDGSLSEVLEIYIEIYKSEEIKTEADKQRLFATSFEGMVEDAFDEHQRQTHGKYRERLSDNAADFDENISSILSGADGSRVDFGALTLVFANSKGAIDQGRPPNRESR